MEIGVVFGVIAFLVVALYTEWVRPAISFMIAVVVFLLFDIFDQPADALHGFANEQLAVIVLLLIVGSIFQKTRIMQLAFQLVFKPGLSSKSFLLRMMGSIGVSSAFLNNTPLVAMFMPYVHSWSRDNGKSPSKFLIPLSYASILGGCVTLVGTSTNLIANGLAVQAGEATLGLFDFAWVGGAMLVVGLIFLLLFSNKLLPDNRDNVDKLTGSKRDYFLETQIKNNSPLIGKNMEEAGLRNLKGLFAVEIIRGNKFIRPVAPTELLEPDDIILFAGDPESIADLTSPGMGLSLPKACQIPLQENNEVVEVVVAQNSRMVGQSVKDSDFRSRYDGAILAIKRDGEKLSGKIGDVMLKPGDLLLVLAGKDFDTRTRNNPGFYVISRPKTIHNTDVYKTLFLVAGFIAALILSAFGVVSLFVALSVLVMGCVLLKMTHPSEVRNSIDFNLIFIIATGLALGKGMEQSGTAQLIANSLVEMKEQLGTVGLLGGIFILTNALSAFMTSKAAVALIMPVVLPMAHSIDPTGGDALVAPFVLAVAFGGAANFLTPVGYQTNLMVYGPGGYSFKDFFKIGLPLTLIYMLVCVLMLSLQFNLF